MKIISRWGLPFIAVLAPLIFLFFIDFNQNFSNQNYDDVKDQVELISWIFSGVMSIISFFGLFIGFTYENKLIEASRQLQLIKNPITLSSESYIHLFSEYEINVSNNKVINLIYFGFLFTTSTAIFIWGSVVGFYTKYAYSLSLEFSVEASINFGIYVFYLLLSLFLISITILLNQIRNLKDPLGKEYLPSAEKVQDIILLSKIGGNIDHIILKSNPSIEIYRNPPKNNPTYEVNFLLPIKFRNFIFSINIYNSTQTILQCDGYISNDTGQYFSKNLSDNFPESLYNIIDENTVGEFKLFNNQGDLLSRMLMRPTFNNECIIFLITKTIYHRDGRNIDSNFTQNIKPNQLKLKYYRS